MSKKAEILSTQEQLKIIGLLRAVKTILDIIPHEKLEQYEKELFKIHLRDVHKNAY